LTTFSLDDLKEVVARVFTNYFSTTNGRRRPDIYISKIHI